MIKRNQILMFYHFVYIHGFPLLGCFVSLKIPVMVKAFITWLTFIASFFYEVYHIFENRKNSELYYINCLHKFSFSMTHTTFGKWTMTNRRISRFLVLTEIFCSVNL